MIFIHKTWASNTAPVDGSSLLNCGQSDGISHVNDGSYYKLDQ